MSTKNLLKETIQVLTNHNKTPADIDFITATIEEFFNDTKTSYTSTWEEFAALADEEYDSGCGGVNVLPDLLIVGKDFWLERHSYDGAEWWEFKQLPIKPEESFQITRKVIWDYTNLDNNSL